MAKALDALYPGQRHPWLDRRGGDPVLYINFYRDGPTEDPSWEQRFASFGAPPAVSIAADISGRYDGWPEARAFLLSLMSIGESAATDDDWKHTWSRVEIEGDLAIDGKRFGAWRA